jgi:alkanesulfonate monooxygenase SsuD/methylene tetrahydromethanopterin reductase-like flavin-dependent oxidoreductase (luciferase family)
MVAIAVPDHYLSGVSDKPAAVYDCYPILAGIAKQIEDLELIALVSPITFRHPAVMLKMAVTIDHMSGGRFVLGVGAGWLDREHELFGIPYPAMAERYQMLEEALGYPRAGLSDEPAGFAVRYSQLEASDILPPAVGSLRLVVGGLGASETPRLAGRYAGEYSVYPGSEDEIRLRVERARSAAVAAGRDFERILLSSSGQVVTAPTEAEYRERFSRLTASLQVDVERMEAHFERRNTPRGSYEQVAEQLLVLDPVGVERFYLQWPSSFDRDEGDTIPRYVRDAFGQRRG